MELVGSRGIRDVGTIGGNLMLRHQVKAIVTRCSRWSGGLTQMLLKCQHPDFPSDLVTLLAAVEATLEVVWKEENGKERLSNHLNIMTFNHTHP